MFLRRSLLIALTTIAVPAHAQRVVERSEWWRDAICYEVFVRSFQDSDGDGIGDLRGLISRLDYINDGKSATTRDLGATCIWLMPVFDSPSYHGYDVRDYERINPQYGTLADFRQLLAEAHSRGIRVIVDFVANHTATSHPWFVDAASSPTAKHRDWYLWTRTDTLRWLSPWGAPVWHKLPRDTTWRYYGIFWSGMPDLNLRNPAVERELDRIAGYWLRDVGVDGFRLDAVKHFIETDSAVMNSEPTHAWLERFATYVRGVDAAAPPFTVGEAWEGLDILRTYYPRQLTEYFNFALADAIVASARAGNGTAYLNALRASDSLIPDQRWATFLTNHDQPRVTTLLRDAPAAQRAAACALLLSPGTPFIYYGEEIGMQGDKPDERIRTPMQWGWTSGVGGGGFTSGKAWESAQPDSATLTVAAQDNDTLSLLSWYRTLTRLRAHHEALRRGAFLPYASDDSRVATFERRTARERLLVRINFSPDIIPAQGAARRLEPYSCRVENR